MRGLRGRPTRARRAKRVVNAALLPLMPRRPFAELAAIPFLKARGAHMVEAGALALAVGAAGFVFGMLRPGSAAPKKDR